MSRPRILDLFCGAGGAGVGYHRAGFEVVGVDVVPQPDYPFAFVRMDALRFLENDGARGFAAAHASPPCQAYTALQRGTNSAAGARHPRLTEPVRDLLREIGLPSIIENPASRPDVVLCGEMFGLGVIRHRKFELGFWSTTGPEHPKHRGRVAGYRHGQRHDGPYFAVYGNGGGKGTVSQWQEAMGIDWTTSRRSIAEAIPPAYTEYLGARLLKGGLE